MPQHHRRKDHLNAQAYSGALLPAFFQPQKPAKPHSRPGNGPYGKKGKLKSALKYQIGLLPQKQHCRHPQCREGVIGPSLFFSQPQTEDHDHSTHGRAGASGEKAIVQDQKGPNSSGSRKAKSKLP